MELMRINTYDWSVFLVHFFNLEGVLTPADDIVIEFVPTEGWRLFQKGILEAHQSVKAAIFGPGNFAIGLK